MTPRENQLLIACKAAYRNISGDYTDGGQWITDREVIMLLIDAIREPELQDLNEDKS